jgi:hypothetical protein
MSGKILERIAGRTNELAGDAFGNGEPDGVEDLGGFGWLRSTRDRSVMIELRKKSGDILAIGYGWIDRIEFDPSKGITLKCGTHEIRIKGRNLNSEVRPQVRLFQGLTRHRVPWLQEAGHGSVLVADKQTAVIESIEW